MPFRTRFYHFLIFLQWSEIIIKSTYFDTYFDFNIDQSEPDNTTVNIFTMDDYIVSSKSFFGIYIFHW